MGSMTLQKLEPDTQAISSGGHASQAERISAYSRKPACERRSLRNTRTQRPGISLAIQQIDFAVVGRRPLSGSVCVAAAAGGARPRLPAATCARAHQTATPDIRHSLWGRASALGTAPCATMLWCHHFQLDHQSPLPGGPAVILSPLPAGPPPLTAAPSANGAAGAAASSVAAPLPAATAAAAGCCGCGWLAVPAAPPDLRAAAAAADFASRFLGCGVRGLVVSFLPSRPTCAHARLTSWRACYAIFLRECIFAA